jgi:purine nucleosidase
MIRRLIVAFALSLLPFSTSVLRADAPPKIILDTDLGGDVDDVGAVSVLNKLADSGECEILAIAGNALDTDKASAATIDAICTYYGRPNIPIGQYHGSAYGDTKNKSAYTAGVRDQFPHTAKPDDDMPSSLDVYRKALRDAPDGSVKIVSIGFLINLEDLLKSQPDTISPLSGMDLIKRKVKQLVVMGGKYPTSDQRGEWNFAGDNGGPHTEYVVNNWPTPILFSGFEIGGEIVTMKNPGVAAPKNSPVYRAYDLFNHLTGRQSWDLTAVLAAVRDPHLYWDIKENGCVYIEPRFGNNTWIPSPQIGHSYLVRKVPAADMGALLDSIMAAPPKTPLPPPGPVPPAAKPN